MLGRLPYRGHLCCDKLQWSRLVISLFMICGLFRWPGLTFSEFAIVLSWKFMPHYWLRLLKTKETNSKNNCVYRSVTLTSPSSTSLLAVGSPLKVFPCQGLKDLVEGKSCRGNPQVTSTHCLDARGVWPESGLSSPLHQSCLVCV